MYAKLAITNARKSIKDYLIYFLTITLCVSLFYAFLSLSSSGYELITEESQNFEMLKFILKYATYLITGLLIILVAYVNNYMVKRRQREFATYILLGTEQKSVALMFFIETLIIGIIAVFFGVFLGTLFSQVVTAIVLLTAEQKVVFNFRLYMDTVAITFCFFLAMFCIIGLYNIRVLRKLKLINMLNAEKKSEYQFKRSGKVYGVVFVLSMILYGICGYFSVMLINNKKDPSVIIINKLIYTLVAFGTFIVATYALFYSLAYIIIYIKEKWINFKYEGTNLFLIGSIVSKIKTAPILMATISITFLGAAVSFILTLIMSQWSIGYLNTRIPYDIIVTNKYVNQEEYSINDIPSLDYKELIDYLEGNGEDLKDYCLLKKYYINKDDFYSQDSSIEPLLGIKLSDFNKLRTMLGYDEVKFGEDEFTVQWDKGSYQATIDEFTDSNATLKIEGKELKVSKTPYYIDSIGEYIYNSYTQGIIILPDKVCDKLNLASTDFYGNIKKDISFDEAVKLKDQYFPTWVNKNYSENEIEDYDFARPRIKSVEKNTILNASLGMRILGIYLGIVLLMISLTVLALQQLADSIEYKGRFNVLRRLGIDEKNINKIVLKQISIYFIIPLSIAMIGVIVFVSNYLSLFSEPIRVFVGASALKLNIVIAVICIISIYICYFIATYYTFKINIKNNNS